MNQNSRIYIAGHGGLLGSALHRQLQVRGYTNIITCSSQELNLREAKKVEQLFEKTRPEYVFLAAAKVGNINANMGFPVDFFLENIEIQNNIMLAALKYGVSRLIYFSSNCAYPRLCKQPISEARLMTGRLETTNQSYAIAKIAGIELCNAIRKQYGGEFITMIPASIYGPADHFSGSRAHMIPYLVSRIHSANMCRDKVVEVVINPDKVREFIYVDDAADAAIFIMSSPRDVILKNPILNVGTEEARTAFEVGEMVAEVIGFTGRLDWRKDQPLGMPKKVLSSKKIHALGWQHSTAFQEGLSRTYAWYLEQK